MGAAAVIVSVVALAATGFGIWLQWRMFQASTTQLIEAGTVLAKLQGVSLQLRETQQEQFQTVLKALIEDRHEVVASAGEQATVAEERLKQLEEQQPQLSQELGELRTTLDSIRGKLRELELQPPTYLARGTALEEPMTIGRFRDAFFQRTKTSDTPGYDRSLDG